MHRQVFWAVGAAVIGLGSAPPLVAEEAEEFTIKIVRPYVAGEQFDVTFTHEQLSTVAIEVDGRLQHQYDTDRTTTLRGRIHVMRVDPLGAIELCRVDIDSYERDSCELLPANSRVLVDAGKGMVTLGSAALDEELTADFDRIFQLHRPNPLNLFAGVRKRIVGETWTPDDCRIWPTIAILRNDGFLIHYLPDDSQCMARAIVNHDDEPCLHLEGSVNFDDLRFARRWYANWQLRQMDVHVKCAALLPVANNQPIHTKVVQRTTEQELKGIEDNSGQICRLRETIRTSVEFTNFYMPDDSSASERPE